MSTSAAVHRLRAVLAPEGLVVVGGLLVLQWPAVTSRAGAALEAFPAVVLVLGTLLAVRFDRGLVLLALAALVAADRGLALAPSLPAGAAHVLRLSIAALLPVNLLAAGLLAERGVWSRVTLARLGVLVGQAATVFLVAQLRDSGATALDLAVLPLAVPGAGRLGDAGAAAWAIVLVLLAVRTLLAPGPVSRGVLWASVAALAALTLPQPGGAVSATACLGVGGLALVIATVETSHSLAYRDGLTGLPSRRALDEAVQRLSGGYTVAMVDIDRFKRLNDEHGHDVGDQVLRRVGTVLGGVGGGGRAFRYGGEEFAVLFPGTSLDDALPILEHLRATVEETPFRLRGPNRPRRKPKQRPARRKRTRTIAVTVSIGAAQNGNRAVGVDAVLKAADEALYEAKRAGRNRVREGTVRGNGKRPSGTKRHARS